MFVLSCKNRFGNTVFWGRWVLGKLDLEVLVVGFGMYVKNATMLSFVENGRNGVAFRP